MTELEKKAKDYVINNLCDYCVTDSEIKDCTNLCKAKQIFIAGYEQAKEDIALSDKLVHVETLEENIKDFLEMRKANSELIEHIAKQKEINKAYVDIVDQLKQFIRECSEEKAHSQEEIERLLEL